ncbi:MAG: hypothetical protein WC624_02180 [Candidatus Margulisiibacteriota bacterium]
MVNQITRVSGFGRVIKFAAPIVMAAATIFGCSGKRYDGRKISNKTNWESVAQEMCNKKVIGGDAGVADAGAANKSTPQGIKLAADILKELNGYKEASEIEGEVLFPVGIEQICMITAAGYTGAAVMDLGEISNDSEPGKTKEIDLSGKNITIKADAGSVAVTVRSDPKINAELIIDGGKVTKIKVTPKRTAKADEVYMLYLMDGDIEVAFGTVKIKGKSGGNGSGDAGAVSSDAGPAKSKGVCASRVDDIKLNECNAKCGAEAAAADKEDRPAVLNKCIAKFK